MSTLETSPEIADFLQRLAEMRETLQAWQAKVDSGGCDPTQLPEIRDIVAGVVTGSGHLLTAVDVKMRKQDPAVRDALPSGPIIFAD